jgi:acetyl esterase/lipase
MRRTALRYGRHHSQVGEVWHPAGAVRPAPVVVLIHGGYWRAAFTKRLMHRLAGAVTDAGWIAWNIEYRRVGLLGGGGGWPATFDDVGLAVDAVARIPGADTDRVVTCGHSAGGHLALWTAARPRLPAGAPGASPTVAPCGAVSLAGVVDLVRAAHLGLGGGAVPALMGGTPDAHPDRYAVASPAALLPIGVPQVLVHGLDDTIVPPDLSERYAADAAAAGDQDVTYVPLPGLNHMDVIDPHRPSWPAMREHLDRLLR